MIQIIPNWHPILVHFTIALYTIATGLYTVLFLGHSFLSKNLAMELNIVARWCLWISAVSSLFTVAAGFYAFSTVEHNEISHKVMQIHRNWGLTTAIGICLLTIFSIWGYLKNKTFLGIFLIALLLIEVSLLITGFLGGELVYRYGLGVISPTVTTPSKHHY